MGNIRYRYDTPVGYVRPVAMDYARYYGGGGPKRDKNYNTILTPEQEREYAAWVETLPLNLRSDYDYDLRGAWLNGDLPDENYHMSDRWKKPWHATFSDESVYSGDVAVGGHWYGDRFEPSALNRYVGGFRYGNWGAKSFGDGGGIHIKKENRGKFTAAAERAGKSVQAYASQILANKGNYSPTLVKRANFARNAAKWHGYGGNLYDAGGVASPDDPPRKVDFFAGMSPMSARYSGPAVVSSDKATAPVERRVAEEKAKQEAQVAKERYMSGISDSYVPVVFPDAGQMQSSLEKGIQESNRFVDNTRGEQGLQTVSPVIGYMKYVNPLSAGIYWGAESLNDAVVNRNWSQLPVNFGLSLLGLKGATMIQPMLFNKFSSASRIVPKTKSTVLTEQILNYHKSPTLSARNSNNANRKRNVTMHVNMSGDDMAKLERIANGEGKLTVGDYNFLGDLNPDVDIMSLGKDGVRNFASEELDFAKKLQEDMKAPLIVDNKPHKIEVNGNLYKYNHYKSKLQGFYSSADYKKRLKNEAGKYVDVNEVQQDLLKNLSSADRYKRNRNYLIEKSGNEYFVDPYEDAHYVKDIKNNRVINGNGETEKRHHIISRKGVEGRVEIHEYVHASDKSKALQDYGLNKFLDNLPLDPHFEKNAKPFIRNYIKQPEEIRARAIETLLEWKDMGVNINDKVEIERIIDHMYANPNNNFERNYNLKQLKKAFSKETLKKIMTKIVMNTPTGTAENENDRRV